MTKATLLRPGLSALVLGCWALAAGVGTAQDVRAFLESPVIPRSGIACPSPERYSPIRPDPPGVPTVVGLGVSFVDILRFDDVDQSLTVDAYVLARWRDARLADPSRGDGSADCPVPGSELWMPAIEPENLRARQNFYERRFLIDASGTITIASRTLATVGTSLDLHDFPFDRHDFRITFWPTVSRSDEVEFYALERGLGMNPDEALQGWVLAPPVASVQEAERQGRLGRFSRYVVTIGMTRDWGYFALKLGVPLLLIVLMAYCVYYIPPNYIAQQIAMSMTSMLTLVAYMLALGSSLPRISYLTRADRLFVGCAILVFLGLVKATVTSVWGQRDEKHLIRAMDRFGRWMYPAALMLIVLAAFAL